MGQVNRVSEKIRKARGQTMTEYAMILATIVVVLVSFYANAGTIVAALVGRVDPLL